MIQRVSNARVTVSEQTVGSIERGMVALVAVQKEDGDAEVQWMASKLATLRIFQQGDKHFDMDITQVGGSVLLVSNFTVAASTRKGRRPSLDGAANPADGERLFDALVVELRNLNVKVSTGVFGADMQVTIVNDGPATFLLDSRGA